MPEAAYLLSLGGDKMSNDDDDDDGDGFSSGSPLMRSSDGVVRQDDRSPPLPLPEQLVLAVFISGTLAG